VVHCDYFIFKVAAIFHLGFSNFHIFGSWSFGRLYVHHHTKFKQNRSSSCGDRPTAFNDFQKGGCPPFWIFFLIWMSQRLTDRTPKVCRMQNAKFHSNRSNGYSDIAYLCFFFNMAAIRYLAYANHFRTMLKEYMVVFTSIQFAERAKSYTPKFVILETVKSTTVCRRSVG